MTLWLSENMFTSLHWSEQTLNLKMEAGCPSETYLPNYVVSHFRRQ